MTVPPPPPRRYIVQGRDGRQHTFSLDELRRLYASGEVTSSHQVFSHATGQWHLVSELPELRDVAGRAESAAVGQKRAFGCGGCLIGLLIIVLLGQLIGDDKNEPERQESNAPVASSPAPAPTPAPVPVRSPEPDVPPAVKRVRAAAELQSRFDASILKGFELKFVPRGKRCDILHVEGYSTLEPGMMDALAYGTLIYGRVLPEGVDAYAFNAGFRDVVYTNVEDSRYRSSGESKLTRKQARSARKCTEEIASKLETTEKPVARPAQPKFESLSWSNAEVGRRLYNGAYDHEVTIVSMDRASDLIEVRYVSSGKTEPKKLSAVSRFWYVKQD